MKRKRILSLLLALTVMATMLMAVPLTANAVATTNDLTETFTYSIDFTETYSSTVVPEAGSTAGLSDSSGNVGLTITFLGGTWKYSSGIAPSQSSDRPTTSNGLYSSGCAIRFTPDSNGKVLVDRKLGSGKTLVVENTTNSTIVLSYGNSTGSSLTSTAIEGCVADVTAGNTYTVYVTGTSDPYYAMYFEPSVPTLSLDNTALSMTAGSEQTLTASFSNTDASNVTWAVAEGGDEDITVEADSDVTNNLTATVKVADTAEVGDTATITATAGELTATCTVTVVAPTKELTIYVDSAITDITFTNQSDETDTVTLSRSGDTLTKVNNIMQGTVTLNIDSIYDITYTNAAPLTYNDPNATTLTVTSDMETTQDLRGGVIAQNSNTFSDDVYSAIAGKTIIWGAVDSKWYPTSFGYLEQIQTSNYWYVAGAESGNTSNSDVYAIVNGGKLHTNGRSGNFQFNANTDFRVPVVKGSTVTIVNYSSDTTATTYTNNNVYTVSENGGATTQVGTYTTKTNESTGKVEIDTMDAVYTYTYSYTGDTNGYVDIVGLSGGYLSSITVTSPQALASPFEDWYLGYNSVGTVGTATVDSDAQTVTIDTLNIYTILDEPVNNGTVTFSADVSVAADNDNGFRIYLENENAGNSQDTNNATSGVIAEAVNFESGKIYTGPALGGSTTTDATYTANTWYHIDITIDYSKTETPINISITTDDGATSILNTDIATNDVSTTLNQIRLIRRSVASTWKNLTITTTSAFGTGASDSGVYVDADSQTVGVIRFLQEYTGAAVSDYGFYIVDSATGEITVGDTSTYDGVIESDGQTAIDSTTGGFYGDLYGIDLTSETSRTYYAKPYATIDGITTMGDIIGGTVSTSSPEVTYSAD